jgi:pilus assembly protein Flp/PilA
MFFTLALRRLAIIYLTELITSLLNDDSGQDLIEYALIASLIAMASIAATGLLATRLGSVFTGIGTKLSTAV